jgi:hypothetical protein
LIDYLTEGSYNPAKDYYGDTYDGVDIHYQERGIGVLLGVWAIPSSILPAIS